MFHKFDLIDQINTEITVHRLVTQDVLVLLGRAGHLVLATQGQDLGEADVKEQPFHEASKHDQRLEQGLVGFDGARVEMGIHDRVNEWDQEFVFVANGADLIVGIENLALIKRQGLHNVLVGVCMDRLFKSLAQ